MGVKVEIVQEIYRVEEARPQACRPHLGASIIGKECERALWYSFRWFKKPSFDGRMLRLFRRGHVEESVLADALRRVGFHVDEIDPSTGDQFHVEVFTHFSGSVDGVAEKDGEQWVVEFKTHNDKSFKKLDKNGVKDAKPEHYSQMQIYMGELGIHQGLYVAVNKNDDTLYIEEVEFNQDVYDGLVARANRIIHGWGVPPRSFDLSKKMSPCNWCDYKGVCHEGGDPDVNCRTCKYGEPCSDRTDWICNLKEEVLDVDAQRKGCDSWERRNDPA